VAELFYTCVTTSTGTCVITSDGSCVVTSVTTQDGGVFKKRIERTIPRDWYWDIKGYKVVPVIYDYDIIFRLLVELSAELFGVKLHESIKEAKLEGAALALREILAQLIGLKGIGTRINRPIIGEKADESVIQVGLDGLKLYDIVKDADTIGKKGLPVDLEYLLGGSKLKLSEIHGILSGIKAKIETSDIPLTGEKLKELVKEHFFEGKVDAKALLYLLFEEDGIEGASLVDKLNNKELFILLDEDEDESEEK